VWSLGRETVSSNQMIETFNISWPRACRFLDRLREFEVVSDVHAKLPREVLPTTFDELSRDVLEFLNRHGYTTERIQAAFNSRGLQQ